MRLATAFSAQRQFVPRDLRIVIRRAIVEFESELEQKLITVESDLDPVVAKCDSLQLFLAARALLQNANATTPQGGWLSVNLIDGDHQWELEFANSVATAVTNSNAEHAQAAPGRASGEKAIENSLVPTALPTVIPTSNSAQLQSAERAAFALGGQLQIWDLGHGCNHVLVVPRRHYRQ